jgi:F-type H+-transporting ATPase subunit a
MMFDESGWTLTHVLTTFVVILFCVWGALAFFKGTKTKDQGLVPPRKMNLRNFFETMAESVFGLVEGAMGEKHAKKFYPLIGALWFYILFGNLIGLIPGFTTPNDTLKTNVGIAVMVFLLTHYYGIKEHGFVNYFKHFMGPSIALAPLIFPIELISHIARPLSLSVRLLGNMMADHKVVMSFFALVPILVPIPFMLLGLLVCFIQALVFCTLTMVYISMAIEHEDEH